MPLDRRWIIGIGFALLLIIAVLLSTGIIPGIRKRVAKTTLEMWGYDRRDVWQDIIRDYRRDHPTVIINYTQLPADSYEADLINRLASGKGPDIFMIRNTWLPKHSAKLAPAPATLMNAARVEELFPTVVPQDFTAQGMTYALPLYIDTLALLYNKDIFDRAGIVSPPLSWIAFQDTVKKLGKNSAAIGGSSATIDRANDLVALLMIQSGAPMIDENGRANFTGAEPALAFYLKFSNPKSGYYAWDNKLPSAFERFVRGELALMFGYQYHARALTALNPALRFGSAPLPQSSRTFVNYPSYAGLAVWNQSAYQNDAWDFIIHTTTKAPAALAYISAVNEPPALRELVSEFQNDPRTAVFANQTLTARSWPQIDDRAIDDIFSVMIDSIQTMGITPATALRTAEARINELISRER